MHTTWHKEPQGSEGLQNVQTAEICKFFQIGFHSSDRMHYSGSLLCNVVVISPRIIVGHLTIESQEGNLTGYLRHCCHVNFLIYTLSHNSEHGTWNYIHAVYFIYTFILPNYSSFCELHSVIHILKKVMYTENPFIYILMYTALVMYVHTLK